MRSSELTSSSPGARPPVMIIEEEKKKLPKISVAIPIAPEQQHIGHVELERGDVEASGVEKSAGAWEAVRRGIEE